LIGGFLFAWTWILLTHVIGLNHFFHISKVMAIAGNYLIFVLVNVLIFYSLLYSNVFEGISARQGEREKTNEAIPPDHIERIRNAMERDKLFLNTRLTLDEFAKRVELPSRQVSAAINQCLQQNFHEFVNRYRVEEAKRILSLPDKERQTVVQISSMSGFNSKAAFNRFFKKFAGMTPSQFRDQHQTTHAPQNKGSSIN
jgi:AraC-type DNA-binding domain-containing proteins